MNGYSKNASAIPHLFVSHALSYNLNKDRAWYQMRIASASMHWSLIILIWRHAQAKAARRKLTGRKLAFFDV